METILCPECRSQDGHYQVVFVPGGIQRGNMCARCKGAGKVPLPAHVWIFTHQDKPAWYSWMLRADSKEALEQKLSVDCGSLIPMQFYPGLVAVQIERDRIPPVYRSYSEIPL